MPRSATSGPRACWTRRGAGGRHFLKGNGFLAAGYVHRSSRAGDMQIHTHVLVANATFAEGRWTRLYHPAIYEHAKTAGYVYEAHLRDELTRRLGVRWREVVNGIAEIEGFDPDHLRYFSTRRQEILEAAGEGSSARARQIATLETMSAKDRDLSTESLRDIWTQKAEEIDLTRESIRSTLGKERQAPEGRVAVATFDVYGHLLPGSYDDVRARMDAYLATGRNEPTAKVAESAISEIPAKD